jgi:hypothetical protein
MRTPIRLAATLFQFRLTNPSPHFQIGHIVIKSSKENNTAASHDFSAALADTQSPAPILWLTGDSDPVALPKIGKFSRRLQESKRTVFLETGGQTLRSRIHEFHPNARLYLTIRLYGISQTHDAYTKTRGAFSQAMEGVRAAQLSGFLVCAHVLIAAATELDEVKLLLQQVRAAGIDGVVVTAGDCSANTQKKVAAARKLIGNSWWAKFSHVVQQTLDASAETPASSEVRYSQDPGIASEEVAAR